MSMSVMKLITWTLTGPCNVCAGWVVLEQIGIANSVWGPRALYTVKDDYRAYISWKHVDDAARDKPEDAQETR